MDYVPNRVSYANGTQQSNIYVSWLSLLRDPITNLTYEATPMNTSTELMESFAAESYIWKWKECCLAAVRCCNKMLSQPPLQTGTTFCF
ncbi:hypothetical protein NPIL_653271 [Nephila pilipes]|uniref:Uncharacterized protein n=1 Tax=Nephila pilipes TaxID=299642 RepID=A0A8X6NL03_NEPPI|nr:hypothetical protein NPIL_653271 [Nephila pilipes]